MTAGPESGIFSSPPNTAIDHGKVPSVFNDVMKRLGEKAGNMVFQSRMRIFNMSLGQEKILNAEAFKMLQEKRAEDWVTEDYGIDDYEQLMYDIHKNPKQFFFVKAQDHWEKGTLYRAVDYIEFFPKKKKLEEADDLVGKTPILDQITAEEKRRLKEMLDASREEEAESPEGEEAEPTGEFPKEDPKKIQEEIDEDVAKIDAAVTEGSAPILEE